MDNSRAGPTIFSMGAQWLIGRVLDLRQKGRRFEPHPRHCVVSLSKNINPTLVLVQPRKIRPFITERLLMGRKESNKTISIFSTENTSFSLKLLSAIFMDNSSLNLPRAVLVICLFLLLYVPCQQLWSLRDGQFT